MNQNNERRLEPTFAPETSFAVPPIGAESRAQQRRRLEELRQRLVEQNLGERTDYADSESIETAAREAAVQAWNTPFPLLVLPVLFEELVEQRRGNEPAAAVLDEPALLVG